MIEMESTAYLSKLSTFAYIYVAPCVPSLRLFASS